MRPLGFEYPVTNSAAPSWEFQLPGDLMYKGTEGLETMLPVSQMDGIEKVFVI